MLELLIAGRQSDALREWRALLARLAELERRVAVLETRDGESAVPQADALRKHNLEQQAEGARLRDAIRPLFEADRGPRRGVAKRVWRALGETDTGRAEEPSLRAVQHHITQLRKAAALRQQ